MFRVRGFTLVEILVVVIILGILGAIVIPQFASASDAAEANTLATTLRIFRGQMTLFKLDHSIAPGYPECDEASAPTADALVNQMTLAVDADGETAPLGTPGYDFGPYLKSFPSNPVNDLATINMLGDDEEFPAQADGTTGWIYQAATLTFKPNCPQQGLQEREAPTVLSACGSHGSFPDWLAKLRADHRGCA